MGEILSEMSSVSVENNVVSQNSDEFKRSVLGEQVLAGQGDHVDGHNQHDQQPHQGGGNNNTLLALQEIPGNLPPFTVSNGDPVFGNEVVERVREKPKLIVTNEMKPRLRWTNELHSYFVEVCNRLGGPQSQCSFPLILCHTFFILSKLFFQCEHPFPFLRRQTKIILCK